MPLYSNTTIIPENYGSDEREFPHAQYGKETDFGGKKKQTKNIEMCKMLKAMCYF